MGPMLLVTSAMANRMKDPSIVANDSRRPCMKRSSIVGSREGLMHQEIVLVPPNRQSAEADVFKG